MQKGRANLPDIREIEVKHMNTISDILMDIDIGRVFQADQGRM